MIMCAFSKASPNSGTRVLVCLIASQVRLDEKLIDNGCEAKSHHCKFATYTNPKLVEGPHLFVFLNNF